jgi:hypothetical protein|tara:strand:+ start:57 stop:215 length:159 start_codon:yes stop_codon:yes gene_type:complete
MSLSIGLGIGIPAGYPEGGGTNPQTFFIVTELGVFINAEAVSNELMVAETAP